MRCPYIVFGLPSRVTIQCIPSTPLSTPPSSPRSSPPRSDRLDMSQKPFQVPVGHPGLELRLHVAGLEGLDPHEAALVVLDAHDALRAVPAGDTVLGEQGLVLEVRELDVDWGAGAGLEAEVVVPGHVLLVGEG